MTEGEILSSKMYEGLFIGGVMYKAIIQYKYTIDEKEYLSNRVFYGDDIGKDFSCSVKTIVKKYVKGEKVLVYYNPEYPNQSVLETGVHGVIYRELFAGILFLFLSVILFTKESFFISFIR